MYRHIRNRFRKLWRQFRHFIYHNVLHADDPPHRIALGAAIGMFITFTPTIGAQMALVVFLTWLFRANKVVGLPIVWLSNPATIIPIFYGCYVVGRFVLQWDTIGDEWWTELYHPPEDWWPRITFFWSRLVEIAAPLWLGAFIVGFLLAYPTYYTVYHIIYTYRMRRWGQVIPPVSFHGKRSADHEDKKT